MERALLARSPKRDGTPSRFSSLIEHDLFGKPLHTVRIMLQGTWSSRGEAKASDPE
jgi:hypothetical protein